MNFIFFSFVGADSGVPGADKDASGADSGAPHADKGRRLEQIEGATSSEFWKPLLSFLGGNI